MNFLNIHINIYILLVLICSIFLSVGSYYHSRNIDKLTNTLLINTKNLVTAYDKILYNLDEERCYALQAENEVYEILIEMDN